jgi:OPA family glycerol-3-phosphate transporter-like MFS transporter 1/2
VSSFAFCLFFSKLIAYTFLYWLPYYIKSTPIQGRLLSAKQAGDLSTLFDVGGVAGGIMAGHLSDNSGCSAVVATGFTIACVPFLYLYRYYGAVSFGLNVALMMAAGFCVNGPYALITTAVSADLGTHESLAGNAKALATVTAIIDGMGSIGAAIGPMLTGYISERGGFDGVFLMLYLSALAAGLLLIKLCIKEVRGLVGQQREQPAVVVAWCSCEERGSCRLVSSHSLSDTRCVCRLLLLLQLQTVKEKKPVRIGSGVQLTVVKL